MMRLIIMSLLVTCTYAEQMNAKIVGAVGRSPITDRYLKSMVAFKLLQANVPATPGNRALFEKMAIAEWQKLLVMKGICDEHGIGLSNEESQKIISDIAKENGKSLKDFAKDLESKGVSIDMFKEFIVINRCFAFHIRSRFGKKVSVPASRIREYKKKLEDQYKHPLYELEEMIIDDPNASNIAKAITQRTDYKGANISSFRSLGWIGEKQLGSLRDIVSSTPVGQTAIVRVNNHCARVILVKNKRIPGRTDATEAFVKLFQIAIPKQHPNIDDLKITFDDMVSACQKWQHFQEKAKNYDIQIITTPLIPFKSINGSMQSAIQPILTNKSGSVCIDQSTHYLYVVMMEKRIPEGFKMPSDLEIKNILEQQEYQKLADREVRQFSKLFYKMAPSSHAHAKT